MRYLIVPIFLLLSFLSQGQPANVKPHYGRYWFQNLYLNTTYNGSGALRMVVYDTATKQTYHQVIPSGSGSTTPTLQDVTTQGNTTNSGVIYATATGTNRNFKLYNIATSDNLPSAALYAASGTNTSSSLSLVPRGTGVAPTLKAQLAVWNTDFIADGTNYEGLFLRAEGATYSINSLKGGTGTQRPIALQMNSTSVLTIGTSNTATFNQLTGTGNRLMGLDANGSAYRTTIDPATVGGTTYTFSSEFTNTSNSISINAIAQSKITNLTSDLAGKQANLVSGTNIKTINGQSVLGSGDLVVSATIPGDLTSFTPRFSAGSSQGDVNVALPVGQAFVELGNITAGTNLTVGLSTSSTPAGTTLMKTIANTNTTAYNWTYTATVKKADGTAVTVIPNGKTHTLYYIPSGSYWLLASEF
jgi:hypothetical protein